jgi:hypothetical protein
MAIAYKTPGVYREESFRQPEAKLPTGIPGFVGFFQAKPSEKDFPVNTPRALHHQEEFSEKFIAQGYLLEAVTGFFANGGTRCYVVRADSNQEPKSALEAALSSLAPLKDLDLLAVPDAMRLTDESAIIQVQQAMLQQCAEQGDRFAILDPLPNSTAAAVKNQQEAIVRGQPEPINAALYYPWLKNTQGRWVPPCGHIAGIFARSDRARGVFKAPANEEIQDALDLQVAINNSLQGELNPFGINCLRAFPGRGLRVWGARTLSQDPNWRYLNVRRLFLTLGRWIDQNLGWASFEPNSPRLWVRIGRELSAYLTQLWQLGALQGAIPAQAFYVKCDAETNPTDLREKGEVLTEIGLATAAPAEFLVIRIIHRAGSVEMRPTA